MMSPEFDELIESIEDGLVDESANVLERDDEEPPSAVFRVTLDGRPYLVIVQPVELGPPDAAEEED